ncbi:MAG: hypothetical protein J7J06_01950 [Methanosarcinales archaeon]|nr:hypothetical protein [Methanosarcinales archaeon]
MRTSLIRTKVTEILDDGLAFNILSDHLGDFHEFIVLIDDYIERYRE